MNYRGLNVIKTTWDWTVKKPLSPAVQNVLWCSGCWTCLQWCKEQWFSNLPYGNTQKWSSVHKSLSWRTPGVEKQFQSRGEVLDTSSKHLFTHSSWTIFHLDQRLNRSLPTVCSNSHSHSFSCILLLLKHYKGKIDTVVPLILNFLP